MEFINFTRSDSNDCTFADVAGCCEEGVLFEVEVELLFEVAAELLFEVAAELLFEVAAELLFEAVAELLFEVAAEELLIEDDELLGSDELSGTLLDGVTMVMGELL